ncbi:hypothetical protein [Chamaesiphon sp.]|uniref:hypothetical protein n=1 Tax=Chamaesiphon sp. TaxID=2814140 RepID=UPI0035933E40
MKTADNVFSSELDERGIAYSVTIEGLYEIQIHSQTVIVNLENIRRNYERDSDADAIVRFVDKVDTDFITETPSWDDVRQYIRYSLEPSDEEEFKGVVFNAISDELNQVFIYISVDGSRITWIDKSMIDNWGITREQMVHQAEHNMVAILAETKFEIEDIDGNKLGMLSTTEIAFKASLIVSPAFRDLVAPTHGWPVYVVVPCRDFVYVISEDNLDFLSCLGSIVIDEYRKSGYPITKDVLQISDDGITAIGTYPEPN